MANKVSISVNVGPENQKKLHGLAKKVASGNRSMLMDAILTCLDTGDPEVIARLRKVVDDLVDAKLGN